MSQYAGSLHLGDQVRCQKATMRNTRHCNLRWTGKTQVNDLIYGRKNIIDILPKGKERFKSSEKSSIVMCQNQKLKSMGLLNGNWAAKND